ncbi:MAG: hypothetical protein VB021_10020 [Oscillospiraceae bacterium]|nr:hypothetical protein [Oscillospiraceae bacterium]
MKLPKKKQPPVDVEDLTAALSQDSGLFDPNGSWTGVPCGEPQEPTQDADDL